MVAVNDFAVTYMVQLPFGGVKGSGYGRFAGKEGLRSLCKTSIPGPMDIPLKGPGAGAGAWRMAEGIVWFGYAPDVMGKLHGLGQMLGI
jgi:hypothetical protein